MLRHQMQAHSHLFEKTDDVKDGDIVDEEEAESDDEAGETDHEGKVQLYLFSKVYFFL